MDKETLVLLNDGLRHIKGFVGVLDRWIASQKEKSPAPSKDTAKGEDYKF